MNDKWECKNCVRNSFSVPILSGEKMFRCLDTSLFNKVERWYLEPSPNIVFRKISLTPSQYKYAADPLELGS